MSGFDDVMVRVSEQDGLGWCKISSCYSVCCQSFLSGIFHLIFLTDSVLQVTETIESETELEGGGYCVLISMDSN